MNPDTIAEKLERHGHLHLFLDSGAEAAVSKHDTHVEDGRVVIDSKEGDWQFEASKVEFADKEPSHLTPAE